MNSVNHLSKRKDRRTKTVLVALLPLIATSLAVISSPTASAATAISLGQASNFAVLAGAGISNTGSSSVQGDLGTSPTVSFSDTGALILTGAYHFGDATATAAKAALATAYASAVASAPATTVSTDLGGQTLLPGTYVNPAGVGVTGTLTLDAQGNPNSVFVIQTPLSLNTAAASQVNIINGGQACNVFWQVGTTTNLGANSDFKGNILTTSNFVGGANAKVSGRVLSLAGSVALNSNTIVKPSCVTPTTLFVVPENKSVVFGTPSVTFTAKYQTINGNETKTIANPSTGNVGWVAPVCAATPVYTPTSPIGTSVISCTGGNGGSLYVLDRSRTATLTVTKVETKVQLVMSPKESLTAGTPLTFSATVSPKSGTLACTGAVTFALDKNPLTGAAGAFAVTSPAITTGWLVGKYRLTATYPGDVNCAAATDTKELKVGVVIVPSNPVVNGAGSYLSPYGKASFNIQIKSTTATTTTPAVVNGKIKWGVDKKWKFEGTLNSYSLVNGVGTASGTGTLYYSSRTDRKGSKWIAATTAPTTVNVKFTTRNNGNDDDRQPMASFAIGFSGTLVSGAPALPILGPLVAVNRSSH